MNPINQKLYTASEVAKLLGVSRQAIHYRINNGLLGVVQAYGGKDLIPESEFKSLKKIYEKSKKIGVSHGRIRRAVRKS